MALEQMILSRKNILINRAGGAMIPVTAEDNGEYAGQAAAVILCEGDAIGAVVLLNRDPAVKIGAEEQKLAVIAAGFLGKQMES